MMKAKHDTSLHSDLRRRLGYGEPVGVVGSGSSGRWMAGGLLLLPAAAVLRRLLTRRGQRLLQPAIQLLALEDELLAEPIARSSPT